MTPEMLTELRLTWPLEWRPAKRSGSAEADLGGHGRVLVEPGDFGWQAAKLPYTIGLDGRFIIGRGTTATEAVQNLRKHLRREADRATTTANELDALCRYEVTP